MSAPVQRESWLKYGVESFAGGSASVWAQANAPWVTYQIISPVIGSPLAYYTIGQMVKSGAYMYAGPVGFAAGVAATRYGPSLAKWTWKQGEHFCNYVEKKLRTRVEEMGKQQFERAHSGLEKYVKFREVHDPCQYWEECDLEMLRHQIEKAETAPLRRAHTDQCLF